jgi:hypothetical protein
MENSLCLTWGLRLYGLMPRVTQQPLARRIQPGPFTQGKKLILQREISSIAGEGYSRYFCNTRQLSQQGLPQFLLPFRSPGFPGQCILFQIRKPLVWLTGRSYARRSIRN